MVEFIPTGIGGFAARPAARKTADKSGTRKFERHELFPPPRPPRNFIPSPEEIEALLERAIAALARGMYWDRGSIINLVL
jgi:hypothetical protein